MRTRRLIGGSVIASMAMALYAVALVPTAFAQDCSLTVEPDTATAGSEFHLKGSGYTPTQLILQKEGGQAVTIDLDLQGADPFEIPIGSRKGDEGRWSATAALPGTCSPSVVFTATLENTDMIDDLLTPTSGRLPLSMIALIIMLGFSGGAVVAWRLHRA